MARTSDETRIINQALAHSLAPGQVHYLKQPFHLTMLHGEIGKVQQRQLVLLVEALQPKIEKWFSMTDEARLKQPSIFDDTEASTDYRIEIKLADLGMDSQYYESIKDAARLFAQQVYEYRYTSDNGEKRVSFTPLFSKVDVPEKGSTPQGKATILVFYLNKQILKSDLMFMTRYTNYNKEVAIKSSLYTAKLYTILMSFVYGTEENGYTWNVDYEELRKLLGVDKVDKNGFWTNTKYKQFYDFDRYVLLRAKADFDNLAKESCEINITYKIEYPNGIVIDKFATPERKFLRGNPSRILFTISLTEYGKGKLANRDKRKRIQDYIQLKCGFNHSDFAAINASLYDMDEDAIITKINRVMQIVNNRKDPVNNQTAYIIRCINNEVEDWQSSFNPHSEYQEAEEVQTVTTLNQIWNDTLYWLEWHGGGKDKTNYYLNNVEPLEYNSNKKELILHCKSLYSVNFIRESVWWSEYATKAIDKFFGEEQQVSVIWQYDNQ